jgi:hypothetical protein
MNKQQFEMKIREWDKVTHQYNVPMDGLLAWGTMFGMYMFNFKPLPILVTGAVIHGYVHPIIADQIKN